MKLQSTKEEYENGLEATLTESLKKYREQSSYWADKISCANIFKENLIVSCSLISFLIIYAIFLWRKFHFLPMHHFWRYFWLA